MPELPEVETVKKSIEKNILHKVVDRVTVNHNDVIKNILPADFTDGLLETSVDSIERRGKYLIFRLSTGKCFVVHLRMTGQLVYFSGALPKMNHCHVVIGFRDNSGLYYRDVRRFGGFWFGEDEILLNCGIEKLGPEPLCDDFNIAYLVDAVKGKKRPIKSILLDQGIVAGIGNIYADEICFAAKVSPLVYGAELTEGEIKSLVQFTKEVLLTAISLRGTTFRDYRDGLGEMGAFQSIIKVYQRHGLPCSVCGTKLEKTTVAGRTTTYCPVCQKNPNQKRIIGVTGGIASGKTLVSDYLEGLGGKIIDADVIAREIMKPNGVVIKKIRECFGEEYLFEDGTLNRKKLREEIFFDEKKVKELNAITHPAIHRRILQQIKNAKEETIVLVAPLLIEAKLTDLCDEVWVIYTSQRKQINRLMKRDGIGKDLAKKIMEQQLSFEEKKKHAQVIIDNSNTKSYTKKQVKEAYDKGL